MQQSPRYSILLYSKYSKRCTELINILTQNNIENIFLKLCIDNELIRKRIKNNKSIEVNLLPCILNVYDNGVVEKFEDDYAFELIRPIITEIQNSRIKESQQVHQSQVNHPEVNKNRSQIAETIAEEDEDEEEIPRPPPKKSKKKLTKIIEEDETQIEDNNTKDETGNDRYKNPPKKKMMISDEHNYIEDEELFKGEDPEVRKEPSKTIRSNTQKSQTDQNSTLAKAKELAQMRDKLDEEINNPRDRPLTRTRN